MRQLIGITNRGRFRDYKTGQKDYKSGQGLQNEAKRLQIGVGIANRCRTYFHPSITEFRIEKKIHTKAAADVSRGTGGRVLLFSWERLGGGKYLKGRNFRGKEISRISPKSAKFSEIGYPRN